MSKKIMLLALAVAAIFAFPAAASAQEIHFKGVTAFTGHASAHTFVPIGEPTYVCTTTTISGSFMPGSTTTANVSLEDRGCSFEFFGSKLDCHTSGDGFGVITWSGVFHVITVNNKPGILMTLGTNPIKCSGFSVTVSGSIIGTITSPACGISSKTMTVAFESSGSTQNHQEYTGLKYDLMWQTESGSRVTTGLTSTLTLTSATTGTLECT